MKLKILSIFKHANDRRMSHTPEHNKYTVLQIPENIRDIMFYIVTHINPSCSSDNELVISYHPTYLEELSDSTKIRIGYQINSFSDITKHEVLIYTFHIDVAKTLFDMTECEISNHLSEYVPCLESVTTALSSDYPY